MFYFSIELLRFPSFLNLVFIAAQFFICGFFIFLTLTFKFVSIYCFIFWLIPHFLKISIVVLFVLAYSYILILMWISIFIFTFLFMFILSSCQINTFLFNLILEYSFNSISLVTPLEIPGFLSYLTWSLASPTI